MQSYFPRLKQDLLKEFYSSLVDEQIRHDLGEYYTADWLAQHLLDQAGYDGDPMVKILHPACGLRTFLVESIVRLRDRCAHAGLSALETLQTILSNVKGLDLNPLAVISARANYILAIYDLVFDLGDDIELPVYLADSINVPVEKTDDAGNKYLEYFLDTEVEQFMLEIPGSLSTLKFSVKFSWRVKTALSTVRTSIAFSARFAETETLSPFYQGLSCPAFASSLKSFGHWNRGIGTRYGVALSKIISVRGASHHFT